jgi:hypothetical protein
VRGTPREILRLTLVVLLVSLPAGAIGAALLGAAGWLLASIAGQSIVVARAVQAWRQEAAPNRKLVARSPRSSRPSPSTATAAAYTIRTCRSKRR